MKFIESFEKYDYPLYGLVRLPTVTISGEQKKLAGAPTNCSNDEFLRFLCVKGFEERLLSKVIPPEKAKEYSERCQRELKVFESIGLVDYILLVWEELNYAKEQKIPLGWGRGSVCGSLACYLIGIHQVDSIAESLYFERFISAVRSKKTVIDGITYIAGNLMADIDVDICYYRRNELIKHLEEKYEKRTSKLLALTTFSAKVLIKDCLKTIEKSNEEDAKFAADLLTKEHGVVEEVSEALENNEKFKKWAEEHKETTEIACKLSGLIRSKSQHPSAILISYDNIWESMPLELSQNKEVVSSYDMYTAQELVTKLDNLGLKTLSVLYESCDLIGIKPFEIDINHQSIYNYYQHEPDLFGIFQLETYAQGNVVRRIKPKNLYELACCLAISRPGAASFISQFCDYTHKGIYKEIHPIVDEVLKKTGGVCLFQEQLLQMLNKLGMNLEDCEGLRKAIGKKLPEKIKEYKEKIYKVCEENKHPIEVADLIWKIADDSSGYQFNLCVSGETTIKRGNAGRTGIDNLKISHLYNLMNDLDYARKTGKIPLRKKLRRYGYGKCLALEQDGRIRPAKIKNIMFSGEKETYTIYLSNGKEIRATKDHKILSTTGFLPVKDFIINKTEIICDGGYEFSKIDGRYSDGIEKDKYKKYPFGNIGFLKGSYNPAYTNGSFTEFKKTVEAMKDIKECEKCGKEGKLEHHHVNGDRTISTRENIQKLCNSCHKKADYALGKRKKRWDKGHITEVALVTDIKYHGKEDTYDIEMDTEEHNFCADGIVVSNSHSVAYSSLSAATTFIKINYPKEFFLALLRMSKNEPDTQDYISSIKRELSKFNVELLPPDLLKSELDFCIKNGQILFSLGAIKNVAEKSFEKLLQFRKEYCDKFSAFLAAKQSGLNLGVTTSLIMSGCLDSLITSTRCYLVMECQLFNILTDKEKKKVIEIAPQFNFDLIKIIKSLEAMGGIKASRMETIRTKFTKYKQIYEQNKKYPKFSNFWYEKYHLGFSYSYTLRDVFKDDCPDLVNLADIANFEENEFCSFVAEVATCYSGKSKAGKKMLTIEAKDDSMGSKRIFLCGEEKIAKYKETNPHYPQEGEIIYTRGKKLNDIVFADTISVQDAKIYIRLSDIK